MTNNMNISFLESDDPQARQTNESVYLEYSRDPVRTPMQWDDTDWAGFSNTTAKTWLPVHKDYPKLNLKAQKEAEKSTFKLYQNMLKLRKENHVLQSGGLISREVSPDVFGFMRTLADHNSVGVLVSLTKEPVSVSLKDLMGGEFNGDVKAKVLIVNTNSTLSVGSMIADVTKISLTNYEAIVVEISSATNLAASVLLVICALVKIIL
jgi:alpha-glucosidase